jgi:alginate O-acetyltransferase complex protein AlgI
VFYGYGQPWLLILLVFSASINAVASYFVFHENDTGKKRLYAILGVVFNLIVLSLFKYSKLLGGLFLDVDSTGGIAHTILMLPLPIGISFYTFQGISLVVDTFRAREQEKIAIDKRFTSHYTKTFFFITFFPQLVAGPIVKAHDFYPQIARKFMANVDFTYVYQTLILGYFLKMVIADNLKDITFWISFPHFTEVSSLTLVAMLLGYSMQIFADFAGYSLIAIGIAALYGYRLPINFDFPYISSSIAEFWRRWHISLSSWLKEYLYFPLGGNRKGNVRTYINLIIVMFLGGLWHGAAWSYAIWGLWHGTGLAIERFAGSVFGRKKSARPHFLVTTGKMLFVFLFVTFGWLLFKLTDISEAVMYFVAVFKNTHLGNDYALILTIIFYSLPVFIYHLLYLVKVNRKDLYQSLQKWFWVIYALMLFMLLFNGGSPGAFVYFQF